MWYNNRENKNSFGSPCDGKDMGMKIKLIYKQLIISLLIGLLPFFLLTGWFAAHLDRRTVEEHRSSLEYSSQYIVDFLDATASNFDDMSQYIIGNPTIGSFLKAGESAFQPLLEDASKALFLNPFSTKKYAGLAIFRNDGNYLISGMLRKIAITEAEKERAQRLRGTWFWSGEDGQLSMCRLIRDTSDLSVSIGYVKLVISPSQLEALNPGAETSGINCLLLLDGAPVYASEGAFPEELAQAAAETGREELARLTAGGVEYEAVCRQTELGGLAAVSYAPAAGRVTRHFYDAIAVAGIAMAAIVAIAQILMTRYWIIRPLNKLTRLMHSVEMEDYSARFTVRGNDEIADVARQFNRMSERLQHLYQQVYQSELKAKDAELHALQAEINPHFILNTLDVLYWTVSMEQKQQALGIIKAISNSFRITLYKSRDGRVSLAMALEHAKNYLYIEKVRLQDNLEYTIDVQPGLDCDHIRVLNLVLQPLIENAVVHGIAPRQSGEIIVMIYSQEDVLYYSVYDNGSNAPVQEEIQRLLDTPPLGNHRSALYNINKRIQLKYGSEYGVRFGAPDDGGSVFIVTQPLIRENEDD